MALVGFAAGLNGHIKLPPHLLAALVPLLVLNLTLDIFCLVDLARAKSVRGAPKIVWVFVILFVSAPIGALVYLFAGRDRGQPRGMAQPTAPSAGASGTASTTGAVETAGTRAVVTTTGLTRDYGGTGLFEVDLLVPRGSIYGLVGPNGAGKTTLLSILAATRRCDSGTVSLDTSRDRIAVCPDVPEFDGWLTAFEVVDLARAMVTPTADAHSVVAALRTAGLADSADRRVGGFSRGMIQRLGLACALVGNPELLILDEPTSALDPAGRAEMLNLVAAMREHRTVIFSSHILADVQRIADQVGILRGGRMLYQGSTRELIDTYLRPSWLIRIAGDIGPVVAALTDADWVARVERAGADAVTVDGVTMEAGERGIPAVIAACGARQVSCEPVAADLESAFLALTGADAGASADTDAAADARSVT